MQHNQGDARKLACPAEDESLYLKPLGKVEDNVTSDKMEFYQAIQATGVDPG
jgi:hypothetical protein